MSFLPCPRQNCGAPNHLTPSPGLPKPTLVFMIITLSFQEKSGGTYSYWWFYLNKDSNLAPQDISVNCVMGTCLLSHSEGSPRASTSSPVFFPFQSTYRQPLWVGKTGFHPGSSWLCNPAPVTISLCLSFVTCKMRTVNIPESEVLMHRGWSIANY